MLGDSEPLGLAINLRHSPEAEVCCAWLRALPHAGHLPLTTPAMHQAAECWATLRSLGLLTADPRALDSDVILCAQAVTLNPAAGGC